MITIDVAVRLDEFLRASNRTDQSPIDAFVRERFAGRRHGYHLIDPMPLNDVLRLCGPLGNWRLTNGKTNLRRLPRNELNRFLSVGLEILAGGERGIAEAVEQIGRDLDPLTRPAIMKYIAPAIRDISDHSATAIRRLVSNAARGYRQSTIKSAMDRYNTGPKAAAAFAKAANAWLEIDGKQRIDARIMDAWMTADGGIASATKVAEDIGATGYQMDMLVASRILVPVVPRSGAPKSYDWFRPNHVREIMDQMVANLPMVDTRPVGMITLTEMLRRTRGALDRVNRALLERTMPARRLANVKPYASILVDMDDVMVVMGQDPNADADFLSLADFGDACGFNKGTACHLAVQSLITSQFRINAATGMERRMIPMSEVDRFRATYISAARLAEETGGSARTITAKMAREGIEPTDTGKARITLFERDRVRHLLPG